MFDQVILGCVMPMPEEANIARVASIRLGMGKKVPAWTVQRNCASGMQAVTSAAADIVGGRSDLVLAGGVESMSHAPILLNEEMTTWLGKWSRARGIDKVTTLFKLRPGMLKPVIGLLRGLTDHTVGLSMGQTAEILASRFNISRNEMDSFAMSSHMKLASAMDSGLRDDMEVIYDSKGNFYDHDDGLRKDSSMESLGKLRPVFDKRFGAVTAGNSAQITDGAALMILASEAAVKKYGLSPKAKIIDTQWAGVDPAQMGLGPANAMAKLLSRNGLDSGDIDYWEINEAFAGQVLSVVKAWSDDGYAKEELDLDKPMSPIPEDKLNIDGGAIAMGHPVGASGARLALKMVNILSRNGGSRGVASLCIGGGQGGAMLIEKCEGVEK
jgi:acetyl-CoA C-acetyltransferase